MGALDRKFIGSPSPSRQNCCNELWPIRLLGLSRKDLDLPHSVHLVHGGCGSVRTSGPDGYSSPFSIKGVKFLTKTVSSLDIDYSLSSHNLNPRFQTLQDSMRGLVHSFVLFYFCELILAFYSYKCNSLCLPCGISTLSQTITVSNFWIFAYTHTEIPG